MLSIERHQGRWPDLIEHGNGHAALISITKQSQGTPEICCSIATLCAASELGQSLKRRGNVLEAPRFTLEYCIALLPELCDLSGIVSAGPGNDQIGFQQRDAFDIKPCAVAGRR